MEFMPPIFRVLLIVLGVTVCCAWFVWIKGKSDLAGYVIEAGAWLILVIFLVFFFIYGLITRGKAVLSWGNPDSIILLLVWLGVSVVWVIGKRLTDPGPGIEKQEVDFRSPEVVEAVRKAQDTLPYFVEQACRHIDGAYVKFSSTTTYRGTVERLWGYVHHYEDGVFNVSVVNDPFAKQKEFQGRTDVREGFVEDWLVMESDGRIKGGYTYIGSFQYLERQGVRLNRTMRKQKSLFVDA